MTRPQLPTRTCPSAPWVLAAWVRENTGGRIEKSAIAPDENLYLVLQDAILFAARWQQEFDPNVTTEGPFTTGTGQIQTADLMKGQRDLPYAQVDGWTAILMPYQEGFTAQVVLPPIGVDPASIPRPAHCARPPVDDVHTEWWCMVLCPCRPRAALNDHGVALSSRAWRRQGPSGRHDLGLVPTPASWSSWCPRRSVGGVRGGGRADCSGLR